MIWDRRTESRRSLHDEPKGMADSFWDQAFGNVIVEAEDIWRRTMEKPSLGSCTSGHSPALSGSLTFTENYS